MKSAKNTMFLIPILVLIITLTGAAAAQLVSRPMLSKKDIHTQVSGFQSYDNETILLIDEYLKNKITFTYFTLQLEQIQKQIISVNSVYQDDKVGQEYESDLKKTNILALDFATSIQHIEGSKGQKDKILKEKDKIKKIDTQIDNLIKKYE